MLNIDDLETTRVEQLWRTHADDLLRYATALVGPSDAPDVAIEAFLDCVDRLEQNRVDAPRGYLLRAVTNRAHDAHRSRRRRRARDIAAVQSPVSVEHDTFLDVRRAVAALSVMQRAVIYLAYWEDLPERAIADVLQISHGSVRQHLVRARTRLRKALS